MNTFEKNAAALAASPRKRLLVGALMKEAGVGDVLRRALMGSAIGGSIGAVGGGLASHLRGTPVAQGALKGGLGGAGLGAMAGGLYGLSPHAGADALSELPSKSLARGTEMGITAAGATLGGGLMSAITGGGDGAKEQADKEMGKFQAMQQIRAQQLTALTPQHAHAFARAQEDEVIAQSDAQMVQSSFDTMKRFAPNLAADPNAVRSFLRESAVWGTGPSYATLKNLADAERTVASAGGAI